MSKDEEKAKLLNEAARILEQCRCLNETILWQHGEVEKLMVEYPEDEFEGLPFDLQEVVIGKTEELWIRLWESVKELKKLDNEMNILRSLATKIYGYEVLPPAGEATGFLGLTGSEEVDLGSGGE